MRPLPYTPAEEAQIREWLKSRHPSGPGLNAEGTARLLATLDRDRKLVSRAASAMREIAIELSDDDRVTTRHLMAVDLDALTKQALDTTEMMDPQALATDARKACER